MEPFGVEQIWFAKNLLFQMTKVQIYIKHIFDIILSSIGIILVFPLIGILFLLVLITMGKPLLFKHDRVGLNGSIFKIYKIRTMKIIHDKSSITLFNDSRITRIGKILRRWKLDELPSLWNVFKGDMSFVGPRPDIPGYADKLKGNKRRVLELRPGITGPASLKYSNEDQLLASVSNPIKYNDEVIFPDKVKINLNYLDNWSLWGDIKIIFNTIFRSNY